MNGTKTRLTTKQAIFVKEIVKGKTQRQACIIAYPKSKKWKMESIDVRANALMKNKAVKQELNRLNNKSETEALWSREIATKELLEILEINKKEIQRILNAHNELIEEKEKQIVEIIKELQTKNENIDKRNVIKKLERMKNSLINLKKQPIINITNINGILNVVKVLNKMYGYTNTKIKI